MANIARTGGLHLDQAKHSNSPALQSYLNLTYHPDCEFTRLNDSNLATIRHQCETNRRDNNQDRDTEAKADFYRTKYRLEPSKSDCIGFVSAASLPFWIEGSRTMCWVGKLAGHCCYSGGQRLEIANSALTSYTIPPISRSGSYSRAWPSPSRDPDFLHSVCTPAPKFSLPTCVLGSSPFPFIETRSTSTVIAIRGGGHPRSQSCFTTFEDPTSFQGLLKPVSDETDHDADSLQQTPASRYRDGSSFFSPQTPVRRQRCHSRPTPPAYRERKARALDFLLEEMQQEIVAAKEELELLISHGSPWGLTAKEGIGRLRRAKQILVGTDWQDLVTVERELKRAIEQDFDATDASLSAWAVQVVHRMAEEGKSATGSLDERLLDLAGEPIRGVARQEAPRAESNSKTALLNEVAKAYFQPLCRGSLYPLRTTLDVPRQDPTKQRMTRSSVEAHHPGDHWSMSTTASPPKPSRRSRALEKATGCLRKLNAYQKGKLEKQRAARMNNSKSREYRLYVKLRGGGLVDPVLWNAVREDLMSHLNAAPYLRGGSGSGNVNENFSDSGESPLGHDERSRMRNSDPPNPGDTTGEQPQGNESSPDGISPVPSGRKNLQIASRPSVHNVQAPAITSDPSAVSRNDSASSMRPASPIVSENSNSDSKHRHDAGQWVMPGALPDSSSEGASRAWSGLNESVVKPIRTQVHRSCHYCGTPFEWEKVCLKCKHNCCKECPRMPKKKHVGEDGKEEEVAGPLDTPALSEQNSQLPTSASGSRKRQPALLENSSERTPIREGEIEVDEDTFAGGNSGSNLGPVTGSSALLMQENLELSQGHSPRRAKPRGRSLGADASGEDMSGSSSSTGSSIRSSPPILAPPSPPDETDLQDNPPDRMRFPEPALGDMASIARLLMNNRDQTVREHYETKGVNPLQDSTAVENLVGFGGTFHFDTSQLKDVENRVVGGDKRQFTLGLYELRDREENEQALRLIGFAGFSGRNGGGGQEGSPPTMTPGSSGQMGEESPRDNAAQGLLGIEDEIEAVSLDSSGDKEPRDRDGEVLKDGTEGMLGS